MDIESKIEYFKNYPDGSSGKRIYDEYNMVFKDFLVKYYTDDVFQNWSRWSIWKDFIVAAFDENEINKYKTKSDYYLNSNCQDYINALDTLELDIELPVDIRQVIAFLIVDGFFNYYTIAPEAWILVNNYTNPKRELPNLKKTIKELSVNQEGLNYLRNSLINLWWWDHTRK